MHHIVFKRNSSDLHSIGVTLKGDLISCIKQQQKDFPNSIIIITYIPQGEFVQELYDKQVERWNQKV